MDTLVAGQSSGHISVFRIGPYVKEGHTFEKSKEIKLLDKNISKVVRTTRNDFALGTEKGIHFCHFKPANSHTL